MSETKRIHFRLTPEQHSLLKIKTQINGYVSMNEFIRDKLLQHSHKTNQRLIEIHKELRKKK